MLKLETPTNIISVCVCLFVCLVVCLFVCLLVCLFVCLFVCLMVFNATFNNISVISCRSVLLVEETTDLSQFTDKLYHIMLYTSL